MNKKSSLPGYLLWGAVVVSGLLAVHHAPTPGPGPQPGPTPPGPVVLSGGRLIEVTNNATRTAPALTEDSALLQWFADQKIGWLCIDAGDTPYTAHGYDKTVSADGVSPPCLLWWDKSGAHRFIAAPADTAGVKAWLTGTPQAELPFFVDESGEKRLLACLPPSKRQLPLPVGGEWSASFPVIPESQWKEIDNRSKFPPEQFVFDQDGIGSCVANGAVGALMRCRALVGLKYVRLAPGNLYSQINGGRDQGAVISDSLTALQKTGVITAATLGSDEKPFYTRQQPSGWQKEAARFRISEAYHCANFDEMMSAVQRGYVIVMGLQVGSTFSRFDQYGVAGHASGPGNHCIMADGAKKLADGRWALDTVNSWSTTWGPWKNGRFYTDKDTYGHGDMPDAYAIQTPTEDPNDPIPGPPKTPKKPEPHTVQRSDCGCGASCCDCGLLCRCCETGKSCGDACTCCPKEIAVQRWVPGDPAPKVSAYRWVRNADGWWLFDDKTPLGVVQRGNYYRWFPGERRLEQRPTACPIAPPQEPQPMSWAPALAMPATCST